MATKIEFGASGLTTFDCYSDHATVGQRWRKWKRSFDYFVEAKGVTDIKQKTALLLHSAGLDVQDIFETLPAVDGEADEYEKTVRALDLYFQPRTNIPYERHVLRQLYQEASESVVQFVTRLRQQADFCEFGNQRDDNIRDQLIEKCKSVALRKQLLEKRDITLSEALEIARSKEAAERQAVNMEVKMEGREILRGEVNSIQRPPSKCFRCGHGDHYAKDSKCPARKETCRKCGKIGHFQAQCRSKSGPISHGELPTESVKGSKSVRGVNAIEDDFAFTIGDNTDDAFLVNVSVGGVLLQDMLIDSGATCNLIGKSTWEELKASKIKCKSERTQKRIFSYASKTALKTLGTFTTDAQIDEQSTPAEFVVIDGDARSILGRKTALELGVLRVGHGRLEVNSLTVDQMTSRFPELFKGIGKLKNYQARLHIDPEVRPVAQKVRRIPFGLRDKVEAEIQNLLQQDIIEPVHDLLLG